MHLCTCKCNNLKNRTCMFAKHACLSVMYTCILIYNHSCTPAWKLVCMSVEIATVCCDAGCVTMYTETVMQATNISPSLMYSASAAGGTYCFSEKSRRDLIAFQGNISPEISKRVFFYYFLLNGDLPYAVWVMPRYQTCHPNRGRGWWRHYMVVYWSLHVGEYHAWMVFCMGKGNGSFDFVCIALLCDCFSWSPDPTRCITRSVQTFILAVIGPAGPFLHFCCQLSSKVNPVCTTCTCECTCRSRAHSTLMRWRKAWTLLGSSSTSMRYGWITLFLRYCTFACCVIHGVPAAWLPFRPASFPVLRVSRCMTILPKRENAGSEQSSCLRRRRKDWSKSVL